MRVAALYDVHGNLTALEAVLAEVDREDVETIVVGGDVAAGPIPVETLERLRTLGERVRFIRGNAERELAEPTPDLEGLSRERVDWTRDRLGAERLAFLGALPTTLTMSVNGLGEVLFCHGSPRSDLEVLTRATPEERLREAVAGVEAGLILCGHTHSQWLRTVNGITVVNAGSVGLPYEEEPGAYWTLLGPDVEQRRTTYDLEAAAEAYRASGYPEADEFVRETLIEPETPDAAVDFFEQLALDRPEFAGRGS